MLAIAMFLLATVSLQQVAKADLEVVREVVIAPKGGRAGANIGSVNVSTNNISMAKADVTIRLGPLPATASDMLLMTVHGEFVMNNESSDSLALTVGFPVSNSMFSSFRLDHFTVHSNWESRAVYNRTTGYPNFRKDTYVSGRDPEGHGYPPGDAPGTEHHKLFRQEHIGREAFQNLMIWHEVFKPGEVRTIKVEYGIAIPLQKNSVTTSKERGGYKGVWPQEANNVPTEFLGTMPAEQMFYFFDYYLTSGASWKGTIGEQTIMLEMDDSWSGHALFRQVGPEILERREEMQGGARYIYYLRNAEPSANLLFALSRPE